MNTIIKHGIEFRQSELAPRIYIAIDGRYIIPEDKRNPELIRAGTVSRNKKGYILKVELSTLVDVKKEDRVERVQKVFNIGRLVLNAWDPNYKDFEKSEVDHIDRNPCNNHLSNLRLVDKKTNMLNRRHDNPTWLNDPEVVRRRTKTRLERKGKSRDNNV